MTAAQWAIIEEVGQEHHVVLVDPADPYGAVRLTPASFCGNCGGDGVDPDSYMLPEIQACSPCEGRGGVPVIHAHMVVLPTGEVR